MTTLQLSPAQTNELVTLIGANAVLVFTHYIAISYQSNPIMEDAQVAKLTGLSERTVKRTRLALTKIGWFLRIKDTYKGTPKITYLIGKQAVSRSHNVSVAYKEIKDDEDVSTDQKSK